MNRVFPRLIVAALGGVLVGTGITPVHGVETEESAAEQIQALLAAAADAAERQDLDPADELFREAMGLAQEHEVMVADVSLRFGKFLYWNGVTGEGLALLYNAVKGDEASAEAVKALVEALIADYDRLMAEGQVLNAEAALVSAREALDAAESGADLRRYRARVLARTEREEEEAVGLLVEVLRESPNDAELHSDFVRAITGAKLFERALGVYAALDMDRALSLWFKAQVYVARAHYNYNRYLDEELAISDYLNAERHILESARLDPELFAAASEHASYHRAWAGWTMLRQDRLDDAWNTFIEALGRNPDNESAIEGLSHIGLRLNEAGKLEQAKELYRQACLWAPERTDFWNNYALLCRDTGEFENSFVAYHRAYELDPSDPRTINDLALILQYHLDRDLDQAEKWLLQAREMARRNWREALDDATAEDQLLVYGDALVNLWRLYDERGDMERASQMVQELREVAPDRPELPPLPGDSAGESSE